jgi:hypothetical protein
VYDKAVKKMTPYKKALQCLEATVGIESNKEILLPHLPFKREVKSLLTDFKDIIEIPYSLGLDGYVRVEDIETETPSCEREGERVRFQGPFQRLSQQASDLRFSLWGNQGFLYRFILYLLEKRHRIFNFHACALYGEENHSLYVIIGEAGSGKTVYLLSGLSQGLKLFSTETVHFRMEESGITWYMGSLIDNIRWGTLIHDFPKFLPAEKPPEKGEEWQKKIALDLSSYKAATEELKNPKSVTILFPRIEQGRKGFLLYPVDDRRKAAKAFFDNISRKLTESVVLYDRLPLLGFEEKAMADARLEQATRLAYRSSLTQVASVLSNPSDCWGNLLK